MWWCDEMWILVDSQTSSGSSLGGDGTLTHFPPRPRQSSSWLPAWPLGTLFYRMLTVAFHHHSGCQHLGLCCMICMESITTFWLKEVGQIMGWPTKLHRHFAGLVLLHCLPVLWQKFKQFQLFDRPRCHFSRQTGVSGLFHPVARMYTFCWLQYLALILPLRMLKSQEIFNLEYPPLNTSGQLIFPGTGTSWRIYDSEGPRSFCCLHCFKWDNNAVQCKPEMGYFNPMLRLPRGVCIRWKWSRCVTFLHYIRWMTLLSSVAIVPSLQNG